MWKTQDGYTLRLPRSRVERIGSQLSKSGLSNLVRRNYKGNLRNAFVRTIGQVARNSLRVGSLFHPELEGEYPVFQVSLGPRDYRIISRPVGEGENAILSVRPADIETEFYDITGTATINWDSPTTFPGAMRASTGKSKDVYILEKRDSTGRWKPYYVGRTDDPNDRLAKHRNEILRHKNRLRDYRVRVGHIDNSSSMTPAEIERVLIRKLKRSTTGVTNKGRDAKPFMVPQGKRVEIRHQGKSIPGAVVDRRRKNKTLVVPGGKKYEFEVYEYEFEAPPGPLVYA